MHSIWLRRSFLSFSKIHQIKEGDLISWSEPILQNGWIIWSFLLYFHFRNFKDPNSSSFIRFQCILHDSAELLSGFWNFLKLNRGDQIFWADPILQNRWIICYTLLYFNFSNSKEPNSLSFIRFQCILHDSAVLFSRLSNFLKLRRGGLISLGEAILQNGRILWSPLLYFNFRNLKDPNIWSFIGFECILYESAVLFSGFWNFLKLRRGVLISCVEPILQNSWIIWSLLLYFNFWNLKDPKSS